MNPTADAVTPPTFLCSTANLQLSRLTCGWIYPSASSEVRQPCPLRAYWFLHLHPGILRLWFCGRPCSGGAFNLLWECSVSRLASGI